MAWHPAEADTSACVTQCPEEIHEVNKFHQIVGDSSDELYRMSDHLYQIEESRFS